MHHCNQGEKKIKRQNIIPRCGMEGNSLRSLEGIAAQLKGLRFAHWN
jgi:hypothetical protein